MDTPAHTAVRAGDHVLPAHGLRILHDPASNHFRMLQHIGLVGYHTGDHRLARGKLHIFPSLPFVLVLRIGCL